MREICDDLYKFSSAVEEKYEQMKWQTLYTSIEACTKIRGSYGLIDCYSRHFRMPCKSNEKLNNFLGNYCQNWKLD